MSMSSTHSECIVCLDGTRVFGRRNWLRLYVAIVTRYYFLEDMGFTTRMDTLIILIDMAE